MVSHSLDGADRTWTTLFVLPAAGTSNLKSDDISSAVAFEANKVGIMWSNQNDSAMYFFTCHRDGPGRRRMPTSTTPRPPSRTLRDRPESWYSPRARRRSTTGTTSSLSLDLAGLGQDPRAGRVAAPETRRHRTRRPPHMGGRASDGSDRVRVPDAGVAGRNLRGHLV